LDALSWFAIDSHIAVSTSGDAQTGHAENAAAWTNWPSALLLSHVNDMILNCDETVWCLSPNNILTWWDTAADGVPIHIQGREKEALTVLARISASGVKWSLDFLAKGKTSRLERSQIGEVRQHWRSHTESGWMTSETFGDYLRLLRIQASKNWVIHGILDLHSSHRTERVKSVAPSLKIELHDIPAGMIDALQPLDRSVFRGLKAHVRRLFRLRVRDNPMLHCTKLDAAQEMVRVGTRVCDNARC
jgi:hypothetical protein